MATYEDEDTNREINRLYRELREIERAGYPNPGDHTRAALIRASIRNLTGGAL